MKKLSQPTLRRLDSIAGVLAVLALTLSFGVAALVWHGSRELEAERREAICQEVRELRTDIVEFLERRPDIDPADVDEFRPVRCAAPDTDTKRTLFLERG